MKRSGLILSVAFLAGSSLCAANQAHQISAIDGSRVLRETHEGKNILLKNERDKKVVMELEYKESGEIAKLRDSMEKEIREGRLSDEEIQAKYEVLGRRQRKAKHLIDDAREDYKIKEKKRIFGFQKKVQEVANDYFSKQGCGMVIDKSTPGVMYLSSAIDKTDAFVKELNVRYKKEQATLLMTKSSKKNSAPAKKA